MSHFIYKAKKPGGEIYKGEIEALDRYELYRVLHESGDEVVSFKEKSAGKSFNLNISIGSVTNRVKMIDRINFARNLGAMLEAGLALSKALYVLERQTGSKSLKQVIKKIISEIERGATLADSLSEHPKVFSPLFIAMVHAGEQSGTLAESLKVVSIQMDKNYILEKRIRGALMYPAVILSAMIVIAILMFIFVIPTLLKTFTDLGVQLPFSTQMILLLSKIIQNQGILVLAVIVLIGGGLYMWSKRSSGRSIMSSLVLKIPIIGNLVKQVNTARTARTLSSLLSSGVDVVEAMGITASVVQNVHFRAVLKKAGEAIKKGDLMSKVFEVDSKLYPVFFAEMMSVGEETGKTGEMLLGVAHYFEEEVEQRTKDMSTIIEPFLILAIGAGVGFFAISMVQPIYSLVNAVK
ncbi:MAG: type II secretion system F family protein [Candidatus Taylorbacteria bacterium]